MSRRKPLSGAIMSPTALGSFWEHLVLTNAVLFPTSVGLYRTDRLCWWSVDVGSGRPSNRHLTTWPCNRISMHERLRVREGDLGRHGNRPDAPRPLASRCPELARRDAAPVGSDMAAKTGGGRTLSASKQLTQFEICRRRTKLKHPRSCLNDNCDAERVGQAQQPLTRTLV